MLKNTAVKGKGSRISQGAGQILFGKGGLGFIARRGVDMGTSVAVQSLEGLARMAIQQPLELISLLPDVVPEVGLAVWNASRLTVKPGAVRIKAMTAPSDGGGEEAPDGSAEIKRLFNSLPDEVGSFEDCIIRNFRMVMFSGMCATEAVPGPRGTGIKEVWPVNSLTLRFKREDNGTLALYQRQTANPNGIGIFSAGLGGMYEPMPMERFFWSSIDGFPDDPYGSGPYSPVLTAVLDTIAFIRDVKLAFHRIGMPRTDIGFDFEAWGRYARDIVGYQDPKQIDEFVQASRQLAMSEYSDMEPDDAYWHGITDKVAVVGAGDKMPDIPGIWGSIWRSRLVQALKTMPTLMGIAEGHTETWSGVDWQIYSAGQESVLQKAVQPLVRCASLHLRLRGMPYIAEAEFEPIRANQRLQEATAESVEIANEESKVRNNWQLNATAALKVTGTAPPTPAEIAADPQPKAALPQPTPAQDQADNTAEARKALPKTGSEAPG